MKEFLKKLNRKKIRHLSVRITALNNQNQPLEQIEGKITQGTINKDGRSTLRNSCSLTLVTNNLNINDYYWGLKTKIKIEVGIENDLDPNFPEIIWFDMGVFILNTFKPSKGIKNYSINISGQDKMSLLNGTSGGTIPHDLVLDSYYDSDGTLIKIPLRQIIMELVHVYGQEDYKNIIIDLPTLSLQPLWYNGLVKDIDPDDEEEEKDKEDKFYLVSTAPPDKKYIGFYLASEKAPDKSNPPFYSQEYKLNEYVGYNNLEAFYPGELKAKAGSTVTKVLDSIVQLFPTYHYYYNKKGQFVFEQKPEYLKGNFRLDEVLNEAIAKDPLKFDVLTNTPIVRHDYQDEELAISINFNPNISNIKNDYSVQGEREKRIIRLRYAIDKKPTKYISPFQKNLDGSLKEYNVELYDWRELIYQMGLDYQNHNQELDFYHKIQEQNPQYFTGVTKYEQYYTEILGFWRELYYPQDQPSNQLPVGAKAEDYEDQDATNKYWRKNLFDNISSINFWFDFLDINDKTSEKSAQNIGFKPIVETSNKISTLFIEDIPEIVWSESSNESQIDGKEVRKIYDFSTVDKVYNYMHDALVQQFIYPDTITKFAVYNLNYNSNLDEVWFEDGTVKGIPDNISRHLDDLNAHLPCETLSDVPTFEEVYKKTIEILNACNYTIPDNPSPGTWHEAIVLYVMRLSKNLTSKIDGESLTKDIENGINLIINFNFPYGNASYAITPLGYNGTLWEYTSETEKSEKTWQVTYHLGSTVFSEAPYPQAAIDTLTNLLNNHFNFSETVNFTGIPNFQIEPLEILEISQKDTKIANRYTIEKINMSLAYNGTMSITAKKVPETIY